MDLAQIPMLWAVVAGVAAWVLFGVGLTRIVGIHAWKKVLLAVLVCVMLSAIDGLIKGIPVRTLALMVVVLCASLWTTLLLMKKTWKSYLLNMRSYGSKNDEVSKCATRIVFGFAGSGIAYFVVIIMVLKNSGLLS